MDRTPGNGVARCNTAVSKQLRSQGSYLTLSRPKYQFSIHSPLIFSIMMMLSNPNAASVSKLRLLWVEDEGCGVSDTFVERPGRSSSFLTSSQCFLHGWFVKMLFARTSSQRLSLRWSKRLWCDKGSIAQCDVRRRRKEFVTGVYCLD